ncbi:MAG: hypothetical protein J5645_05270 [Lachnospiraceae bacterium]|nr:hypothetical protein [Lachnospiraceae bacterium]
MKKWLAMILVLCMTVVLLAGCGDKDDDKKKKNKASITKGDMFDMLEAMGNTTSGEIKMNFNADGADDNGTVKGSINLKTDAENNACSFSVNADVNIAGKKVNLSLTDAIVMADGNLYVNLPEIAKAIGGIEPSLKDMVDTSKLGWFKLPLPDDMPKVDTAFQKKLVGTFVGLFENMTKSAEMTGEDGDYTAKFASKDAYVQAITAISGFVKNDLKGLMNDSLTKATSINIDLNKYVEKIISEYKNDLLEVGKDYGLDESMLNAYIDQIKAQDLNKMLDEAKAQGKEMSGEMLTDEQIGELVKQIDATAEKLKNSDEEIPVDCKARVYTTDDSYKAEIEAVGKKDGSGKITISMEVIPGAPSIKAPSSDAMSLKSIADIAAPFIMGGVKPTQPTPTEAPDDPTPTPTEKPADPTPTEAPAEPTPTEAPADNATTSYKNGKVTIAMSKGGALTFDMPGNYTQATAAEDSLVLLDGTIGTSIMTFDYSNYSEELILTGYKAYGDLTKVGDWYTVDVGQGRAAIQIIKGQLVQIMTNGDMDYLKSMIGTISNIQMD